MIHVTRTTVAALAAVKNLELGYTPKNLHTLMAGLGVTRRMVAEVTCVSVQSVTAWRAPIDAAMHRDMSAKNWRKFLQMWVELTGEDLK